MNRLTASTIQQELGAAAAFLAEGLVFSAAARLGALWAARASAKDNPLGTLRDAVSRQLQGIASKDVERELSTQTDRLTRILSFGSKYEYEELVLILTIRLEIAFVVLCFKSFLNMELDVRLDCDEKMLDTFKSSQNLRDYYSALDAIRKNWRKQIPFELFGIGIPDLLARQLDDPSYSPAR